MKIYLLLVLGVSFSLHAQQVNVSSGAVTRFENFPSNHVAARTIDVWLPKGYDKKRKYAVLYMQDGQMLYDSTTTWNKQEWKVDETISTLLIDQKIKECIVVGIWNGGNLRHVEYFPQKPFEQLPKKTQDSIYAVMSNIGRNEQSAKIQSDKYLKFLVEELKPFIDSSFSTHTDQKNTFIAGSSMGALISLYAICEYPSVFYGAACISTHWPGLFTAKNNPVPGAFMSYLASNLPIPGNHKIYFDYGTETLDTLYKPFQLQADKIMANKGFSFENWITKEFAGKEHSEKAWSERLYIPLEFLMKK